MPKEELFDVISYKVRDGKRGTTIVHNLEGLTMEQAEKKVEDMKARKLDLGTIEIIETLGLDH